MSLDIFTAIKGKPVIKNFTLTVPTGKKVALVGATGSGKTTIVNLLMRFYETDSGEIRINKQNIRDIARGACTEKAIQDAMRSIMQGRTSIVIAHRLSTIRDSDFIVVMDHGEIVESGSHEQLLARRGKYHELYMTQFAGFST